MILSSWTTVYSLRSIISTNHMTPLCDHPVTHFALTNRHNMEGDESWAVGEMQIFSEALAQPAQFYSVEELGQTGNIEQDM